MKPLATLTALAALAALGACSDDDATTSRIAVTDIVTVVDAGAPARFVLDGIDDSGFTPLTFAGLAVDSGLEGERVLLRYYPADAFAEAQALGVGAINCGDVRKARMDTTAWDADPVEMISLWRTGDWLNMRMRVRWNDQPRLFHLVVDEATLADSCPVMYLVHNLRGLPSTYLTETYASWNIAEVINRRECKEIEVHVNDLTNLSTRTVMKINRNNTNQ